MIARARGLTTRLVPLGERARKAIRAAWLCVVVAAGVLLVVVPVGYAAGGNHVQVERAAGYGLVVAIGILLRTHRSGRAWLGLLIGSVVGLTTSQILVNLPPGIQGELTTLAPAMALTLAMIDGFGERRLRGYRDAIREAAIVSLMFAGLAFVPNSGVEIFSPPTLLREILAPWILLPTTAVIGGFFGQSADGRRYPRPPAWLTLVALAMMAGLVLMTVLEGATSRYWLAAGIVLLGTIAVPAAVFLGARALAVWLHPRLLLYSQLGAYLRVMWVPMGSLAIGYLIIIIVFAGFYGMLARFSPESFANVGEDTGIITWVSFAFFTGVGADYTHIVPVSTGARALVGAQLIPTIGWVLVMFAAVMAYLQPQLQRIARRDRP